MQRITIRTMTVKKIRGNKQYTFNVFRQPPHSVGRHFPYLQALARRWLITLHVPYLTYSFEMTIFTWIAQRSCKILLESESLGSQIFLYFVTDSYVPL